MSKPIDRGRSARRVARGAAVHGRRGHRARRGWYGRCRVRHRTTPHRGPRCRSRSTAVDQPGELHAARPSMVEEGIERGADGTAGVEYVIAQPHIAALDVEADGAFGHDRPDVGCRKIVTVELDVEHTGIHGALFDTRDELAQPLSQRNAAPLDANQGPAFAAVALR